MKKAKNKSKHIKDYKKANLIFSLIGLVLYIVQLIFVLSIFYLNLLDNFIIILFWELFLAGVIILLIYTDYSRFKNHKKGTELVKKP